MGKPTLEELEKIRDKRNEEQTKENLRVSTAIKLKICPDCGGEIYTNFFGVLFDYVKCENCKKTFHHLDDANLFS